MKNKLLFCPLGGSGEIGMNMNLYSYEAIDCVGTLRRIDSWSGFIRQVLLLIKKMI